MVCGFTTARPTVFGLGGGLDAQVRPIATTYAFSRLASLSASHLVVPGRNSNPSTPSNHGLRSPVGTAASHVTPPALSLTVKRYSSRAVVISAPRFKRREAGRAFKRRRRYDQAARPLLT